MRKNKVIKCLDGKERIFVFKGEGERIEYCMWKNGKPYGKTSLFTKIYPKFVTREMIFGTNA